MNFSKVIITPTFLLEQYSEMALDLTIYVNQLTMLQQMQVTDTKQKEERKDASYICCVC